MNIRLKLTSWKLRYQLAALIAAVVIGFGASALISKRLMNQVMVNGPVYQDIVQGKDLVADILPPPEYLVESWQIALEMLVTPASDLTPLIEHSKRLEDEFKSRHTFWEQSLTDKTLRNLMLEKAYKPGLEFLNLRNQLFIPAIQAGDKATAERALITMKASYQQHRIAIDEVVVLANSMSSKLEKNVLETISHSSLLNMLAVLAFLSIVSWVSWLILSNIINKLGGEPGEALACVERMASGDFSLRYSGSGGTNLLTELNKLDHKLRNL